MSKKITNPKELELGKFYKSENNEYFKVTGFDTHLGTSGVLFMWDDNFKDYSSTPNGEWIDAIIEEDSVYEISEQKFYKAFEDFYKKQSDSLQWELGNLELVRAKLYPQDKVITKIFKVVTNIKEFSTSSEVSVSE